MLFLHRTRPQTPRSLDFLNFLEFHLTDLLDIVLVALLLYAIYKLVRGTVAIDIFIGIVMVWALWKLTGLLQMKMISSVVGAFMSIGLIALIIVFQQEIRKFLLMLGSTNVAARHNIIRRFNLFQQQNSSTQTDVKALVNACKQMAVTNTGALIVIARDNALGFVKTTGDAMHIKVNQPILESIFFKNSPLHDGAVIIEDNYITATRVILPVSENRSISLRYGLRHRAAVGITEKTDALCLVVSEETGTVSYLKHGTFVSYKNLEALITRIAKDLQ